MLIPEPDLSPYQFLRPLHLIRVEHERQLMIGKELSRLAYLGNFESVTEIGGSLLEELDRDHAAEKYLMRLIVIDLDRTLGDKKLESSAFFFDNLGLFARGQQRHLAWENDLVLRSHPSGFARVIWRSWVGTWRRGVESPSQLVVQPRPVSRLHLRMSEVTT